VRLTGKTHGSPLCDLAEVDGLLLALDMEGEEGVSELGVECVLDLLLARDGTGAGKIGASASGGEGAKGLGGVGVVELRGLAEGFELLGALVQGGIVDCASAGSRQRQVSKEEAAQVPKLAVLRQQERAR
jgi:hypothetical protein